jgi:hypothetical protein
MRQGAISIDKHKRWRQGIILRQRPKTKSKMKKGPPRKRERQKLKYTKTKTRADSRQDRQQTKTKSRKKWRKIYFSKPVIFFRIDRIGFDRCRTQSRPFPSSFHPVGRSFEFEEDRSASFFHHQESQGLNQKDGPKLGPVPPPPPLS